MNESSPKLRRIRFAIIIVDIALGAIIGSAATYWLVQQRMIPLVGAVVVKPADLQAAPRDLDVLRRSFESLRQ